MIFRSGRKRSVAQCGFDYDTSLISGNFQSSNDSSLDLFRPSLTVLLNRLDSTEGFGLWLRPASVTSTDRAFVLTFLHLARLALRPSALFRIFTGSLRFGL